MKTIITWLKDNIFPSEQYATKRCVEILLPFYLPETVGVTAASLITGYGPRIAIKKAKEISKFAVILPYEAK